MSHTIIMYRQGDYVSDDCGAVYRIELVGSKYYHLKCVFGNGISGSYYITDVNDEFKQVYKLNRNEYSQGVI